MNEIFNEAELQSLILHENLSVDSARIIIEHLQNQMRHRYKYLIGEWQGAVRAKSTSSGQFVSLDEVMNYIKP